MRPSETAEQSVEQGDRFFGFRAAAMPVIDTGLAALGVALITLVAIGFQIVIANRQLNLARQELTLVDEELQEIKKQPNLMIQGIGIIRAEVFGILSYTFRCGLRNWGSRTSQSGLIYIDIPRAALLAWPDEPPSIVSYEKTDANDFVTIAGRFAGPVYPDIVSPIVFEVRATKLVFREPIRDLYCFYKIVDDFGLHPTTIDSDGKKHVGRGDTTFSQIES